MIGDAVSMALVCCGLMFFLGAAAGLVRFPDFYTRMHAAGKGDTLSTLLIMAGLGVHLAGEGVDWAGLLVAGKILAICLFIMLTSPTSTHALMQAGFEDGIKPYRGADDREGAEPGCSSGEGEGI